MTTCPACQRDVQEDRQDCPYCGVIFAKWKDRAAIGSVNTAQEKLTPPGSTSSHLTMTIVTSKLTRVSFWLALVTMVALGLLTAYAKFSEPTSSQESLTFDLKPGVTYKPGQKPANQVVMEFAAVLRRNTGQTRVPETELPSSREQILQAITSAPYWAKDFHSHGGNAFWDAMILQLENFVPDAAPPSTEEIWHRQRSLIESAGISSYRTVTYTGPKPIPIGAAHRALTAMRRERTAQLYGFLAVFVFFGFLGFKLLTQFNVLKRLPSGWRAAAFFLLGWFIGVVGIPLAWLEELFNKYAGGDAGGDATIMGPIGGTLIVALGILVPLSILSALWDVLVYPGTNAPATSLDNLAGGDRDQGKYAKEESHYRHVLAMREKALGPNHPDVSTSLDNLAQIYRDQGKYAEAEPLYRRALSIREKALGPSHRDLFGVLLNYASLLRIMQRTTEADQMEARAWSIWSKQGP